MNLFAGLTPAALEHVGALARVAQLPKENRIFNQGDGGVRAHAVIAGSVRISQSDSTGAQVVVRFIGPGEMFGAVSLFTDGRYPADADTMAETTEASWGEADVHDMMTRHPQIAINLIGIIGKRLQEAQERARELATQSVEQRVANAVLRLASQAGRHAPDGMAIEFPLRRKDVADISGTTLHTASRILTAWERAGFLASGRLRITLREPSALRRIAETPARTVTAP